jgi:hypothetical protein
MTAPNSLFRSLFVQEGRTDLPIYFSSPLLLDPDRYEPEGETPLKRGLPLRGSGRFWVSVHFPVLPSKDLRWRAI